MDDLGVVIHVEALMVAGCNHNLAILDKDIPIAIHCVTVSYGEVFRATGRLTAAEMDKNRELLPEEANLAKISLDGSRTEAGVIRIEELLL